MKLKTFAIGVIVAAVLQTGALAKIIYDRAGFLRDGQEIHLRTNFVDPRDLFRGHYVRLNLVIGDTNVADIELSGDFKETGDVFMTLKKSEDGFFEPVSASATRPDPSTGPVLRGDFKSLWDDKLRVEFPFDRYFAPKLRALELENIRQDDQLGIILAVDENGNGMIKGILIDGELFYDEPLF
jgi:uncharacterized membrane-anchored protein